MWAFRHDSNSCNAFRTVHFFYNTIFFLKDVNKFFCQLYILRISGSLLSTAVRFSFNNIIVTVVFCFNEFLNNLRLILHMRKKHVNDYAYAYNDKKIQQLFLFLFFSNSPIIFIFLNIFLGLFQP